MFGWGPATRIYLAAGATDMRKGFEGLYGLARDRLLCEPLSGHVFLFANAQRNRLKPQLLGVLEPEACLAGGRRPESIWRRGPRTCARVSKVCTAWRATGCCASL